MLDEQSADIRVAKVPSTPGDPDPERVKDDVADGYVSMARALMDYGVVVTEVDAQPAEYEVDRDGTARERDRIRAERIRWLEEDPEEVARRYREGALDNLDLVRHYGVIVDWGTGELLPRTTETFRAKLRRRAAAHWKEAPSRTGSRVARPTATTPGDRA